MKLVVQNYHFVVHYDHFKDHPLSIKLQITFKIEKNHIKHFLKFAKLSRDEL